jgi:hypothetical protein
MHVVVAFLLPNPPLFTITICQTHVMQCCGAVLQCCGAAVMYNVLRGGTFRRTPHFGYG